MKQLATHELELMMRVQPHVFWELEVRENARHEVLNAQYSQVIKL
jgi:hypothetical protein